MPAGKVWISHKDGKTTPIRELVPQHLSNILRLLKDAALAYVSRADGPLPPGTSWRDYVPAIFAELEREATARNIDWEGGESTGEGPVLHHPRNRAGSRRSPEHD